MKHLLLLLLIPLNAYAVGPAAFDAMEDYEPGTFDFIYGLFFDEEPHYEYQDRTGNSNNQIIIEEGSLVRSNQDTHEYSDMDQHNNEQAYWEDYYEDCYLE